LVLSLHPVNRPVTSLWNVWSSSRNRKGKPDGHLLDSVFIGNLR
jgi:hypothetical protein